MAKVFQVQLESDRKLPHPDGNERKGLRYVMVEAKDRDEARMRAEELEREVRAGAILAGEDERRLPNYSVKEVRGA